MAASTVNVFKVNEKGGLTLPFSVFGLPKFQNMHDVRPRIFIIPHHNGITPIGNLQYRIARTNNPTAIGHGLLSYISRDAFPECFRKIR